MFGSRDHRGLVIVLLSQNIALPHSIAEVEDMAAVRALDFARELGIDSAVLEGDSELVINSLNVVTPSFASLGLLIQDAKIFTESFHRIRFSHVCHERNSVAHNLARHAIHVTSFLLWIEDVPPHLLGVIHLFGCCWLIKIISSSQYIYIYICHCFYKNILN